MSSPSPPRSPRPVTTGTASRLSTLVLGSTPGQRFALTIWLISFVSYVLYAVILGITVVLGYTDRTAAAVLVAVTLVVHSGFYVVFRSGRVAGRARAESIGVVQLISGMAAMWATYTVAGPAAPAFTVIMGNHILYAGFSLPARSVRALTALGLTGLAGAMLIGHHLRPDDYPAGVQLVTFLTACVVLPTTSRLAAVAITLQERLRSRSEKLRETLTRVEGLATIDELTGIHNRRHLSELLRDRLDRSGRDRTPLCVAMIDLDRFKAINDRYGHADGDEVLRRFAAAAAGELRADDLFGRWGGEEFLLALPGLTLDDSSAVLARLAGAVAGIEIDGIDPEVRITFSAGLVVAGPTDSIHTVVERADRAMYRAKTAGRNRVETECGTGPAPAPREPGGEPGSAEVAPDVAGEAPAGEGGGAAAHGDGPATPPRSQPSAAGTERPRSR